MKFPFGAGKFPVCRFLGNVAGDRVVGETLACVIPVCPQPRVRHLHPILPSEFSPISLCWETATPVWRGNCKIKRIFFYFCASLTHPFLYPREMEQCGCSGERGWFILASFTDLQHQSLGSSSNGKAGSAWGIRNTQGLLHRVMNSCPPYIQSIQTRRFRL